MTLLLDRTGRGPEAETLARRNLDTAQVSLGAADPITLEAAERLGMILWHLGKTELAEAVLRKNVDDRRRVLKPEHPDTLRSVYLLSRVLRELKQFADAEEFAYAYAHSIQCSLGSNHPDYVVALTNQADVYRDKGDLVQAERHYGQAAREAQVLLGATHPKTRAAVEQHAKAVRDWKRLPELTSPIERSPTSAAFWSGIPRVARLPLDIAAHARTCSSTGALPASAASGRSQILARHRDRVSRPARVHLASIDQLLRFVEDEEIGGAGGLVRLTTYRS